MREPDWDRLKQISAKLDELTERSELTRELFRQHLLQARDAVGDCPEELEPIFLYAEDPEWLEDDTGTTD
jgi:hypothetical protein